MAAQAPELVVNDIRHRVLPLYFSRPISRLDYVAAKLGALAIGLLALTLLPVLVLFAGRVLAAEDVVGALGDEIGALPGIVGSGVIHAVVLASLGIAISLAGRAAGLRRGSGAGVFLIGGVVSAIFAEAGGGARGRRAVPQPARHPRRRRASGCSAAASPSRRSPRPTCRSGRTASRPWSLIARLLGDPRAPLPADHDVSTLTLAAVSRWYGNVVAVNDVSFEVGPGITGLLGPNGAGKTTLLHMMAGFLAPSAGDVKLDGTADLAPSGDLSVHRLRARARGGLRLPHRPPVRRRLGVACRACPTRRAAAERAIDLVELQPAADRAIGGYSKGMRQRAKVAAALVHDPPVLILDEPFNGMDPRQRLHMMDLLRRHGGGGPDDPVQQPHPRGGRAPLRPGPRGGGRAPRGERRLPPHPPPDDRSAAQLHASAPATTGAWRASCSARR